MTNNPVFHFFHTPGNTGPLVLRLATAGIFFFHGTQKALGWFGGAGWTGTIETWTSTTGLGLPAVIAPLVMVSELAICAGLFLGFFTRLAGIGAVLIMSGALFVVGKSSPAFPDLEFPLMVWAAGLALFCLGGGALSVDRAISRNLLPVVG
ncbi:MAG: DoxX family protein [Terrimicrobiaceae bacterium]|nr:DoxX family protein [Terrimicrobiaceae bacterium]